MVRRNLHANKIELRLIRRQNILITGALGAANLIIEYASHHVATEHQLQLQRALKI
jgi:hypothetical protein